MGGEFGQYELGCPGARHEYGLLLEAGQDVVDQALPRAWGEWLHGLGEAAALSTVEQRKGKTFISVEEFAACCNKLSKTHIEQLKALGAFAGMAETSQITFF